MELNHKTKFIIEKLKKSNLWQSVDEKLFPLLNEINTLSGLTTDVSCEGHGISYPYIFFTVDGGQASFLSIGILVQAISPLGWIVSASNVSSAIYFVISPVEAIANLKCSQSRIKIPIPENLIEKWLNYDFDLMAKAIEKARKMQQISLKKPLFKIPNS
jgi:hypothetical protein